MTLGPVVIVGSLYWLTMPAPRTSANDQRAEIPPRAVSGMLSQAQREQLETECQKMANLLRKTLGPECQLTVSPPFLLGGNLPESELQRYNRKFVQPIRNALQTSYFDRKPSEPITLLLFSDDEFFQKYAKVLDGGDRYCYSGYYRRGDRRIVLNIGSGDGTLAHELTHALGHFDFPKMPEWFDEGLASLHEECEFSPDGLRLIGLPNWRHKLLIPEIRAGRLESTEKLMSRKSVRGPRQTEAIRYAHARYFCMYLQHRQLLTSFYRKFRATAEADPTGIHALKELLHVKSLDKFDRDFQQWVLAQPSQLRSSQ
ncbi:MAG: hypothetical protein Tsb009_23950 [Planctomycetaceae bacterium]